jgi:hypothetical protein
MLIARITGRAWCAATNSHRKDHRAVRRRATDADYAAMAADYEANPLRADEVLDIWINPDIERPATD